jgi:hypothetical protein
MGRALVEDDDLKDFYRILKASASAIRQQTRKRILRSVKTWRP